MQITVEVPREYASQLAGIAPGELSEIISLGIREWQCQRGSEFAGLRGLLETLATLPEPQDVLNLRPTQAMADRANELLEISRQRSLSEEEEAEWQRLEFAEHLVRIAKARAAIKVQQA